MFQKKKEYERVYYVTHKDTVSDLEWYNVLKKLYSLAKDIYLYPYKKYYISDQEETVVFAKKDDDFDKYRLELNVMLKEAKQKLKSSHPYKIKYLVTIKVVAKNEQEAENIFLEMEKILDEHKIEYIQRLADEP